MADRNTVIKGSQIKDSTVTEFELNTSVAGAGLAGGGGTPLSVNVDASTIEINVDTLRLKDDGIKEVKLNATNSPTDNYILSFDLASGGFTWVPDSGATGVDESDLVKEDFTGSLSGSPTDFVLANIPVFQSLQVFLNGLLQQEGSGNDYEFNPDSGDTQKIRFAIAPDSDDTLIVHYVINN